MRNDQLSAAWTDLAPEAGARCRQLRTKMMHVTSEWEAHATEHPSATAAYWCLRTMGPVGPDERPCHLADCKESRACWEAAD